MLKKPITYEDYDGKIVTEDFYFNLSKTEMMELEANTPGGIKATLEGIVASQDVKSIMEWFKKLVLASYGVKSDDGRRFIKNAQIIEEFQQTPAWDALFFELATDTQAAIAFTNGIMPKDLQEAAATLTVEQLANQAAVGVMPTPMNPGRLPAPPEFPPPTRGD